MKAWFNQWPRAVWLILALSLLYRLILVHRGGQMFYPDEWRYYQSVQLLDHVRQGELKEGLSGTFEHPAHIGFTFFSLIPASLQGVLRVTLGIKPEECWWLAASYFALCSTGVLAVVYGLARRMGAEANEALLALLLAAGSASLARYCRHLLPYDASLLLGLLSLYVGLGQGSGWRRSFVSGLLAGGCFLVYNGYWPLAGIVLAVHTLRTPFVLRVAVARASWAFTGLILPLIVLVALAKMSGVDLIDAMSTHSGSLIGGSTAEGWWISWAYLWHSEHAVFALALYLQQILGAHVLHQWPVFGRLVRPLIPFLALAAAVGWSRLRNPAWGRLLLPAAAALALANTALPLRELFPSDWFPAFKAKYPGQLRAMGSNLGPIEDHLEAEFKNPAARYVFLNYRLLKPIEGLIPPPEGKILWRRLHPAQYPYNH
jgi:hypothetical protein